MAAKIPIRTVYTGSTATGLAEFQSGEFIDYGVGGTGLTSLGTTGQALVVNSAGNAIEWGTPGDITGVTAGTGLSGGGTSGTVTVAIDSTVTTLTGTQTLTNKSFNQVDILAEGDLRLQDTTGGQYVALQAPGTVSTSWTATLPAAVGSSGQALRTSDGSGTLEWFTPETGDLTAITAGAGLTGGGNSGAVTLDVVGGTGITANANDIAIDATVATLTGSQTLTNKTLTSPVVTTPQINDTSADHQYVFAVSELAADRTVTLPLLTGNDEFTFNAHTQTLTNKTLTSPDVNTPDIDGGTIDGATIATSDITVGSGKTLNVSAGTLTLANNQISGDAVEGGTIAATTITALTTAGITASANIDIGSFEMRAQTFESDVATGTAPLVVASTTKVTNLNADLLDGMTTVDEDNMASNSATSLPTQQSVKAYVDSQVTAQDLDVTSDSGTIDIDLDSETLTIAGTANEIETSASGTTLTIGLPNNVTIAGNLTVSGTQTTVSSTTIEVADPLLSMATNNNTADAVDIGFYGLYDTSGSQDLYSGLFRDASDSGKWKLFKDNQAAPTTTVNTSGTGYAVGTLVANLEGAVTGNATTSTALATGRTIASTGDVVWTSASFDGSGNVTGTAAIGTGVIVNADVNASAALDATKIADGSVTSAEFQYINTLTSNAQTQLDTKATKGFSIAMGVALG